MRIVALAGLPGTGKSTLARALGAALQAPVLDKDRIRAELFAPDRIEYSRAQDDFCCRVAYERAEALLATGAARDVVVDGRTYSKSYQVDELVDLTVRCGADLVLIECIAAEQVVRARLEHDARTGEHPAANRSFGLYLALRQSAQAIVLEKLVVDTGRDSLADHVEACLAYLQRRRDEGLRAPPRG